MQMRTIELKQDTFQSGKAINGSAVEVLACEDARVLGLATRRRGGGSRMGLLLHIRQQIRYQLEGPNWSCVSHSRKYRCIEYSEIALVSFCSPWKFCTP